jgi:glutathionylspermidine synthase
MEMNLPWQIVEPLGAKVFAEIRRAAIFECCKWDPQVEDVGTLSPMPLVLTAEAWSELVSLAEKLSRETIAAESAILQKRLLKELGLPWTLRRKLSDPEIIQNQSRHLRLIRFDFHFTRDGWRISEANTDAPGGFNEASGFTRLVAPHYENAVMPGDPTFEMVQAIREIVPPHGTVALVHATAFSDDRQVMVYLARRLQGAGLNPVLVGPDHLRWENGKAFLAADWAKGPVEFVFRFFPTEWLTALPRRCAWWHLLGSSQTPLCNPAAAIVSQSKRFPLLWREIQAELPAWRALLPRTFDTREIDQTIPIKSRVFKPIFGRVGDMIKMDGLTAEKEARLIDRSIRRHPKMWVAQERFDAVPLCSPIGDFFPCIGIYTLNSRVIGAYGRIARRPLIDHLAQDAAVLVAQPKTNGMENQLTRNIHYETSRTLQTVGA